MNTLRGKVEREGRKLGLVSGVDLTQRVNKGWSCETDGWGYTRVDHYS